MILHYDPDKDHFLLQGAEQPTIPGTKKTKVKTDWLIPATLWHYMELKKLHPEEQESVDLWVAMGQAHINVGKAEDATLGHAHEDQLRAYQRTGVCFLQDVRRGLLADDAGLGKTPTAIVATDLPTTSTRLIICPSGMKHVWEDHLATWSTLCHQVEVLASTTPTKRQKQLAALPKDNLTLIVGWEQLRLLVEWKIEQDPQTGLQAKTHTLAGGWLSTRTWDALLVDEGHRAKDKSSRQTIVMTYLAARSSNVLLLSGTPIVTEAADLWPLLHALYPKRYNSYWQFYNAHVHSQDNYWGGKTILGTKNAKLLRAEIAPFTLRRLKKDYLKELPAKVETEVWLDMLPKQAKAYTQMEKEMIAEFPDTTVVAPLKVTSYLRCEQIAFGTGMLSEEEDYSNKIDALLDIIDDEAPHKVFVVCTYRRAIELIVERLHKHRPKVDVVTIQGGMPPAERLWAEKQFVNNPACRVLVGSLHAVKEGFTFVSQCAGIKSDLVVLTGLPDSPKDYSQVTDRLHRLGQKDTVRVLTLLSKDTVEEKAVKTLGFREAMVREIVGTSSMRGEQRERKVS